MIQERRKKNVTKSSIGLLSDASNLCFLLVRAIEYGEHIEHFANSEDKVLEGRTVTEGAEVHSRTKHMTELKIETCQQYDILTRHINPVAMSNLPMLVA
jgi:hypothetical protein